MVVDKTRLGATGSSPNDLGNMGALRPILGQLAGNKDRGQMAIDFAQQLYPAVEKADPYEAALQFFLAMGQGASQPGATVLGSAVGAMQAPADYLAAKKKEKRETDQARMQTALSLAPSLKPPTVKTTYGKPDFYMISRKQEDGTFSEPVETALTPKQFSELPTDGSVKITSVPDEPSSNKNTFKERKFFKSGFDPVVVKNPDDAKLFETQGWNSVPPEGWTDSKGGTSEDTAEVQSSSILDSGVIIYAFKDGTRKVVNSLGEEVTGEDAQAAIKEAEERGVKLQQDRSGARRAGTVGVNTALNAFTEVGKIRKNIANLTEALNLVEVEGANTGKIESFIPNWRAATIELSQVRAELGLDVVGSVTFGALSEGELNIALATALPIELQEQDLIDWLNRKITAQKKLSAYLEGQAIFLSDGDKTVGDWLRHVREQQEELKKTEAKRKQQGTNYNFPTMTETELENLDLDTLDSDQIDAYLKRMDELGL
tara:strand:+ start:7801 stop:9261 length:1461 start_codon:yes stop_codon:yes gene_type:complete